MRKWILCIILLLTLPALACSFSFSVGDETPEPSTPAVPLETPAEPVPLSTPVAPTPTSPEATGPSFYDIFFASAITADEQPIDTATEFSPGTSAVYAFATYQGMTDGSDCESVWYLDGSEAVRTPFVWSAGTSGGPLMIAYVEQEGGLPSGIYEWELYVDGQLAVGGSFPISDLSSVLFEDDFSDPGSGWEVGDYDEGSVGYVDGAYFVRTLVGDNLMWGVANRSFDNLVLEVDATQISAPANNNNGYGVMCRVQPNGKDGYLLRISGDGYCAIHKVAGDNFEELLEWTESAVILQGNASNHLVAICDGTELALRVNGELVAMASDSTFQEGDIALTATSFEEEPTEVRFDNVSVRRPEY
jgi:hypothetical protein